MDCPYCGEPMEAGWIPGTDRILRVAWIPETAERRFLLTRTMLTESGGHADGEGLRKRFPFVHTLERDKMPAVETLYHPEPVFHIIIGKRRRLRVGQRARGAQVNVIPVDVGAQSIVDERRLCVKLVGEFPGERMGMLRAVAPLGYNSVAII